MDKTPINNSIPSTIARAQNCTVTGCNEPVVLGSGTSDGLPEGSSRGPPSDGGGC